MTKKISIYHFLIAVMLFSLVMPAGAAAASNPDAEQESGSLTIHKFSQPTGTAPGAPGDGSILNPNPEGTAVAGVTYTVTQTHEFNEPGDWTPVSGTPFTMVTGADGTISKADLPLGRYKVKETSGPADLNLNPETFTIEIPMTSKDGKTNNYDVHIYPKNEEIRGAVQLTKIDGKTEAVLPGVQFDLFDSANTKIEGSPFTTNSAGQINVEGLKIGDYTFSEIATIDGYVLGGDVEFTITKSGTVKADGTTTGDLVKVTAKNYKEPGVEKTVDKSAVNRGEEVTYTIKVDLPADIKDYKYFVVTDPLDNNLNFVSEGPTPVGFTFTRDGQNLKWTGDPAALTEGSATFTFKAKVSDTAEANVGIDNIAKINYTNKHDNDGEKEDNEIVIPTVGGLAVIKQDGKTKVKLQGAEFELQDSEGNVKYGPMTTDANGVIDFGDVNYGDYKLVETKAPIAADGKPYKKLRNPIDVTINANNSDQTIEVDNYKSGWELPKTGGIGTILFTLIGLIFMGTAIYLYIRRRRQAA